MSCTCFISVPNPNYAPVNGVGSKLTGLQNLRLRSNVRLADSWRVNTSTQYINVPSGRCISCIKRNQNQYIQRIISQSSKCHMFFMTLTYNDRMLPFVYTDTGEKIYFAYFKHFQDCMKRFRKAFPSHRFSYSVVSERGSKKMRPHFHILLFCEKQNEKSVNQLEKSFYDWWFKNWSVNVARTSNGRVNTRAPRFIPLYTPIYKRVNGVRRCVTFDFHYVTESSSDHGYEDVAAYVSKYVLKFGRGFSRDKFRQKVYMACTSSDNEVYKTYLDNFRGNHKVRDLWKLVSDSRHNSVMLGLNPTRVQVNVTAPEDIPLYLYASFHPYQKYVNVPDPYIVDRIRKDSNNPNEKAVYPLFINHSLSKTYALAPFFIKHCIPPEDMVRYYVNRSDFQDVVVSPRSNDYFVNKRLEMFDKIANGKTF